MELFDAHLSAFGKHALHAFFTGFLPVFTIALLHYLALKAMPSTRAFAKVGLMFALVGAMIGLFLGSSREPVVQAIVPAIVTLITGYLGWTLRQDALRGENMLRRFADSSGERAEAADTRLATAVVIAAVSTLMLSTATSAMWGASMRLTQEQSERSYEEWRIGYEQKQLPIEIDLLRREAGLPLSNGKPAPAVPGE